MAFGPLGIAVVWSAASFLRTQAATTNLISRPESIRPVTETTEVGPPNPHKPAISRRSLKSAEQAAPMTFEVALKMRNFPELQQRIARGELISPREMAAQYDPLPGDYQAAAQWLTSQGFKIARQDPQRLALFASGTVGQVRKSFQVAFARVTLEGKEYTSAITPPKVPANLSAAWVGINGLQPHLRAHPRLIEGKTVSRSLSPAVSLGPYDPSQIATAYNATPLYNANVTGAGQTIAIVMDTGPSPSALSNFWTTYGINRTGSYVFKKVVSGTLPTDTESEEEASLDVEWSGGIAPAANVRLYATVDFQFPDLDAAYQQIYADAATYGIHQMSMSFGGGETTDWTLAQVFTDTQYYAELAGAGVTIFASSGDGGSTPGETAGDNSGPTQVEYPASDPNVIGVGGTTLTVNSDGSINSETAWGLSGGGASIYFNRPAWQTGNGVPGGTTRLVPDVACPADPGTGALIIVTAGQGSVTVGGTSWSSPTWVGFCALLNQTRAAAGLPWLGLLGPKIYPLLGTANFHDITSGNNGGFTAGPGYDEVTGIGSPNVQAIEQSLDVQTLPAESTVAPGQNATFTATTGGTPTGYQWQRLPIGSTTWANLTDGGSYSGSATASLTISGATAAMSGDQFQCQVTTSNGTVTSAVPSVLVVDTPLIVTTMAGQVTTTGTQDGTGAGAQFNYPSGVATDSSGNIYVADYSGDTIRKITPDGVVTTPYGQPGVPGSTDNPPLFNGPNAVAIDGSGNLYVADSGNDTIRKIVLSSGVVSTFAGVAGSAGSTDSPPLFNSPEGIAVDLLGNVYVADTGNATIREITPGGVVTTLAGASGTPGWIDATGSAAAFDEPISIAVDSAQNVYVADLANDVIREITPGGAVTTPYGRLQTIGAADGLGTYATFNGPCGLCVDGADNLYVTDSQLPVVVGQAVPSNNLIRRITPAGVVSTIAGQAGIFGSSDGTGAGAQFNVPQSIILDPAGTVYIADTFNQTIREGVTALPVISISATQPNAAVYGPVPGQFTVTRTGSTFPTLTVNTSVGGTAVGGSDYTALPATVTLSPGASAATITVNPLFNGASSTNKTVQLTLDSSSLYTLGTPDAATVTITEPTSYQAWKLTEFGANAYVPSIGGDLADPNRNGVPNILEYAFNSNPLQPGTNPSPQLSTVQVGENQYLALTYTQIADPNFTYTVQVTGDLAQETDQWHSGSSYTTVVTPPSGSGASQVTVRDNTPLSTASGAKRFIRLQVSGQ